MNFFFGLKNEIFLSRLTIPRFQNSGYKNYDYEVFSAEPKENKWSIKKVECKKSDDFFYIDSTYINNNRIFFLASTSEVKKKFNSHLLNLVDLNSFTDSSPIAFRSNFRIYLRNGGFSSYQSEYPYDMVIKNGNILSSVSTLLNNKAEENFILIKNIYHKPIIDRFKIYFVNLSTKKILKEEDIYSNTSNLIFVDKSLIYEDVYIFSDNYLGIPIFISKDREHLSMEHTHPLHHYILSDDRFRIITEIKNEVKKFTFK
tara:strand:+ start:214 stop:987 length:774 start_codon:yes stop_codon:yes gene_type:complete